MNPNILILGAPGAGKGTQSDNIVDEYGVDHVTTGDALRSNKGMDISHLGLAYDTPGEYMDKGELVPDEVVNEIVETALDEADGYVLDGYPRNLDQAEHLSAMTDLDVVLYLDVDEDVLVERLTGRRVCEECGATFHVDFDPPEQAGVCDECGGDLYQREDDSEETARERIRVYEDNTAPVVEFYDDRGELARVDGEQTPDEVWGDVSDAIETHA
ncbi:adenylate kinase [Halorussus halobius]|uniref:adenylate kinase n=1 Tax=Halorussus halobius TaxID=1710537 RepID=UPI0010931EEF|nr:adenylate kinase [Halorussus halobius]